MHHDGSRRRHGPLGPSHLTAAPRQGRSAPGAPTAVIASVAAVAGALAVTVAVLGPARGVALVTNLVGMGWVARSLAATLRDAD